MQRALDNRARGLKRIVEVDPFSSADRASEMKIVSAITEPVVIDPTLRHIDTTGGHDPFEGRAPRAVGRSAPGGVRVAV